MDEIEPTLRIRSNIGYSVFEIGKGDSSAHSVITFIQDFSSVNKLILVQKLKMEPVVFSDDELDRIEEFITVCEDSFCQDQFDCVLTLDSRNGGVQVEISVDRKLDTEGRLRGLADMSVVINTYGGFEYRFGFQIDSSCLRSR